MSLAAMLDESWIMVQNVASKDTIVIASEMVTWCGNIQACSNSSCTNDTAGKAPRKAINIQTKCLFEEEKRDH